MKKTLEWTHPALHLVQKALVAAVAIIAAVGLFALPAKAFAEDVPATDLTAPAHDKTATPNGDGTYKITLSVTGNSVQSSTTSHADVIVVMDLSYSMNYGQYGDYEAYPSRLLVAKNAVNSLAKELLANNTTDNPDAVHISLVTFGSYATISKGFTKDLQDFQTTVNGLKTGSSDKTGGTNWEDGLTVANHMATDDPKQTYIIFVSDGDPTFRNTPYGDQRYKENAQHIINGHTIYGSGNSDNNGNNYYFASQVAKEITGAGKTLFSVGVFGSVSKMQNLAKYAYKGQLRNYYKADDQDALNNAFENIVNTITTNISYTNVKIEDTLNSKYVDYVLPDGAEAPHFSYSYTKNGEAYTPAAAIPAASLADGKVTWNLGGIELEKGVTYAVSFDVKLKQEAYDEAAKAEGDFKVDTNGAGTLSYQKITHVTGEAPEYSAPASLEYEKPQVTVPVSTLKVSKTWIDGTEPSSLVVNVLQDSKEYKTVTLDAAHGWTADVKVAAGPRGHEYSVTEECGDEWQQSLPHAVKLTGLVTQTGTQEITNTYKTGKLTLTKKIKGNAANIQDKFAFKLSCADLKNMTFGEGESAVKFDSEGNATVELGNDETITLSNVPAGKTITITESSSSAPNAHMTTTAKVGDTEVTFKDSQDKSVSATVSYGPTTDVVYTNQTEIAPDTGLDFSTTSQGVLLGVAAAGAATLSIAAIRKSHGERKEK